MQLIKLFLVVFLTIVASDRYLFSQTLTEQEYKVINDLFGCLRDSNKYRAYQNLASDSVYNLLIETSSDNVRTVTGDLSAEKLEEIIRNVETNIGKLDTDISLRLEKTKLERGISLKGSPRKGVLLSRPVISGNHAVIYAKSHCVNYTEQYIFAKKILGQWIHYGDFIISTTFVDPIIPKNWRWKNFWKSVNVFRDKDCDRLFY
ncbi:hypothetical protein [Algoriphagus namhaensis]